MKLSIVVPCYNEAANLPPLLARLREVLADRPGVEAVLVNNGSTDDSHIVFAAELRKKETSFLRVVEVPVNRGYGHGILAGLRAARGDYVGWTHADLQTDPLDVLKGYDRLKRQIRPKECLLRGRRVGRPIFDRIFTAAMSLVASLALRTRLSDINAQPKLFHRDFLQYLSDAPDDFSLDLFVLARARQRGMRFLEQPVHFGERRAGEAKGGGSLRGKIRLSWRTVCYIRALRMNLTTTIPSRGRKAG